MAARHRVDCLRRRPGAARHEPIVAIGGTNPDGTVWSLAAETAIIGIDNGWWQFYAETSEGGWDLVVATMPEGKKYLAFAAPAPVRDALIASLPECP